jgi:DNA polymerase III subunit gamma/tau
VAPFVEQFSAEDAQLYYQIALHGRRDLPYCREPRMGFEMTLLRMLAFRPAAEAGAAPSRPVRVVTAAAPESPRGVQTSGATRPPTSSAADRSAQASTRPNVVAAPTADWATVVQSLDMRGPARQLADSCDLKSNVGGAWQLVLPADKEHLNTQQVRARLEAALREQYGRDVKLSIVVGQPSRPTPAETRRANESTRMRETREAIENDANVKAIQAAFDATLESDSIRSSK